MCSEVSKQPQNICNITLHTSKSKCKKTAQQCKIPVQNRQKGSQKLFSDKSCGPHKKLKQLSRDSRHKYQQEREVVGADWSRRDSSLRYINSEWIEKRKTWSVHNVAVSARRTYNTAVSTRSIHALSMYRRTPATAGNAFQDLPRLREPWIIPNAIYNVI